MRIPLFRIAHISVDTILCILVYLVVYLLRFEGTIPQAEIRAFWLCLPLLVSLRLLSNYLLGLYSHLWKYIGIHELFAMLKAVALGSAGFVGLTYLFNITGFPRSIFVFEAAFYLLAIGGVRFSRRFSAEVSLAQVNQTQFRSLIVGAGDAGAMVAADMLRRRQMGFVPVGFIDDNPQKWRARLHNLRVFGGRKKIADIVESREIDTVILAMPSASRQTIREYLDICQPLNVQLRIVPATHQILSGEVKVEQLRQIQIEDLLGRDPVRIEDTDLKHSIQGKRILITGAGGSIGSELCRQILSYEPEQLLMLGHGENSIYQIQRELQSDKVVPIIADIRSPQQLTQIFARYRPEQVFHAAAHKHVPLMEENLTEAFLNNVLGSYYVMKTARDFKLEKAVLISTDKAVTPMNIMGLSKYFAELICHHLADAEAPQRFNVVRFGNVIGSRGSVIPLFEKQIALGGPITVTHPEMTRFFMTIPEAVQLVLQASVITSPSRTFILDMGQAIRIVDLAKNMLRLSGYRPDEIEIRFTQIRPGEKLHESLVWPDEKMVATSCAQIKAAQAPAQRLEQGVELLTQIIERLQTDPQAFESLFEEVIKPHFEGFIGQAFVSEMLLPAPATQSCSEELL